MKRPILVTMLTLLLATMLVITLDVPSIVAQPALIVVPDDYPTIQDAIIAANLGDVIHVSSGTYVESLYIDKPVMLIGEDRSMTVIDVAPLGTSVSYAIGIAAEDVRIMELTISYSLGPPPIGLDGIAISGSSRSQILNNAISGFWYGSGIALHNSSHNVIKGNHIEYSGSGIYLDGTTGTSTGNIIAGNHMQLNGVGIETVLSSGNIILYNNFDSNGPPQAVVAPGDVNRWDDGSLKGNWWSDYTPPPPYTIDQSNQDNSPLITPKTLLTGDITGPTTNAPDGKIDIRDVAKAAMAYGSYPNRPEWDPVADITGPQWPPTRAVPDNKVDIKDIATIAKDFGKIDP